MNTVSVDPADQRRTYRADLLRESDLAPTWVEQFRRWFADATAAVAAGRLSEANAMVFATAAADGTPSARTVLLKEYDERGFVLFTNYSSDKGAQVAANPRGALVFPWYALERQVIARGGVSRLTSAESAVYFHSRPRGSQLGAWASPQSRVIPDREILERRRDELAARWPDEIPLPPFWGGLRVEPVTVEFWQGRPDRLHDRLRFRRVAPDGDWIVERLAP